MLWTITLTVSPKTIAMRTALRKVLADQGLSYVIKDEVIYVTTAAKAREMMSTRVYYVGDLVNAGDFADGTRWHPAITGRAKADNAKMIIMPKNIWVSLGCLRRMRSAVASMITAETLMRTLAQSRGGKASTITLDTT